MSTRLAEAHIEGQARIRRLLIASLTRIWNDLPGHNRENLDEWLSRAVPLVETAQRSSVAFTDQYIARVLGRGPLGIDPGELIGAAARNGVAPETVYERPFVTLWSKLGNGLAVEEATAAALARATSTAGMDVQLAMRGAADAIDEADTSFYGYERQADADACPFCLEVNGAYVKASAGFAFALHNGCGCGLVPKTEPHRGAVNLPDGTQIRAYQYGPLNDNVAVQEHGELGAVLVNPTDEFTSPADL